MKSHPPHWASPKLQPPGTSPSWPESEEQDKTDGAVVVRPRMHTDLQSPCPPDSTRAVERASATAQALQRTRPTARRILAGLAILACLTLLLLGIPWKTLFSTGSKNFADYVTDTAKRGPLAITVTESGQLDSLKNANVVSNVQGLTTIISIVPEGTQVEAGDVVCELDASALIEQREKQEIAVTQADGEHRKAIENLEIQKTQNESNLSAATLKHKLAVLDLDAFSGQKSQEENELRGNVLLAEDELSQAQEDYDFYIRNAKKGYANQQEVEGRRIRVNQAANKQKVAEEKLALLKDYTFKRRQSELDANKAESEREIERVQRTGKAALAGFEADKHAKELTLKLENDKLKKLNQQIAACKLIAPQRGEVVYSEPDGRRGNDPQTIQEGASVRERQQILKLPDLSQMK